MISSTWRVTRRAVLAGGGIGLAGCLGDDEPEDEDDADGGIPGPTVNGIELRSSFPVVLRDPENGDRVADIHYHDEEAHWHRQPLLVPLNDARTVVAELALPDGELLDVEEAGISIEAEFVGDTPEELLDFDIQADEITVHGRQEGEGEIRFIFRGDAGEDWVGPELAVVIEPAE